MHNYRRPGEGSDGLLQIGKDFNLYCSELVYGGVNFVLFNLGCLSKLPTLRQG